jgi:arginine decarboxylase
MKIQIVWGIGKGSTEITSFDHALKEANIHNFNLIFISSIIPRNSQISETGSYDSIYRDVGDIIHVVMARNIIFGGQSAAGLAWALADEGGIFLEAHGNSAEEVEEKLEIGIEEMIGLREWTWKGEKNRRIVEIEGKRYVCALVAAVYDF